jgi:hypothetical protein
VVKTTDFYKIYDCGKPPINIPKRKSKQRTNIPVSITQGAGPYATLTESRVKEVALLLPGHVTDPAKPGCTLLQKPQVNHTAVRASYLENTQTSFKV